MWIFFLLFCLWAIAFCASYFLIAYRDKIRNVHRDRMDCDVKLPISLFVPFIGIIWGGMEIALYRLGIIGEWEG